MPRQAKSPLEPEQSEHNAELGTHESLERCQVIYHVDHLATKHLTLLQELVLLLNIPKVDQHQPLLMESPA